MSETVTRKAARLLLVNQNHELLLLKITPPTNLHTHRAFSGYWAPLGGELQEGETFEAAALRELIRETGKKTRIGPAVLQGEWTSHGQKIQEVFFLLFFPYSLDQISRQEWSAAEKASIQTLRWWSLTDLKMSQEPVAPPSLVDNLAPLLSGHIPKGPLQIELSGPPVSFD
jgi:ADP-ribose pyrophosphatase YjhB (NUDIX family)